MTYSFNKRVREGHEQTHRGRLGKLKRLGRFLRCKQRYVIKFTPQKKVYAVNAFADSDKAGDKTSRKSPSGGVLALGDHILKTWSKNQSIIVLSGGEAELYAINYVASGAIGLKSLLHEMGVDVDIRLSTDSSAAKAMISRTGLGKM